MTIIFFGEKVRKQAMESLISSIHPVLLSAGFKQLERGEWERSCGWKVEEVDFRLWAVCDYGFQPAFRVAIQRSEVSPVGDTHHYIAERKLPQIVDPTADPRTSIAFPKLAFQINSFIARVVAQTEQALRWFDQFATPELFKASLDKFAKRGSPAYIDAEKVLNAIAKP